MWKRKRKELYRLEREEKKEQSRLERDEKKEQSRLDRLERGKIRLIEHKQHMDNLEKIIDDKVYVEKQGAYVAKQKLRNGPIQHRLEHLEKMYGNQSTA